MSDLNENTAELNALSAELAAAASDDAAEAEQAEVVAVTATNFLDPEDVIDFVRSFNRPQVSLLVDSPVVRATDEDSNVTDTYTVPVSVPVKLPALTAYLTQVSVFGDAKAAQKKRRPTIRVVTTVRDADDVTEVVIG